MGENSSGLGSGFGRRPLSTEATLASIELQLVTHGQMIERVVNKVDNMDKTLTEVKAQVSHLVTKEACAEGRKDLSDDLKARMDGDREITGMNITLPKLLEQYTRKDKPSASPAALAKNHSSAPPASGPKPILYYVKAVSSIVSLFFAVLAMTFFIYKMMDRMEQQQEVMQTIQRDVKQFEHNYDVGQHSNPQDVPILRPDSSKQQENPVDGP
jgi:hypothetical protein